MKASIVNGKLIIEIDMNTQPEPSATGKTLVVASTRGNKKCGVTIGGKELVIGLNAYIPR